MTIYDTLGVPEDASAAEIEAAYQARLDEYQLNSHAPADLQALAQERVRHLQQAYTEALAKVTPAKQRGLSKREWLWMGAGVGLALIIIFVVANLTRTETTATQPGLVELNRPAPDIALPTLDGGTIALSELRGKVVLVNFWATFCEPCKYETPDLVEAYEEFKDQGLVVIGVNLTDQDDLAEVRSFVDEYEVSYPIALDNEGVWQDAFGVFYIPHTYFIDSEGVIRYTRINVVTHDDIKHVLTELTGSSNIE